MPLGGACKAELNANVPSEPNEESTKCEFTCCRPGPTSEGTIRGYKVMPKPPKT